MEQKLQRLFNECKSELKGIGIDIADKTKVGNIDISIAKRKAKRYGCCKHENPDENFKVITRKGYRRYVSYQKFNDNHIEISRWVLDLNEDIIKNTIMHEIIHCFPYCNDHGKMFKKYAKYINTNLGYNISRLGDKKKDFEESNLQYEDESLKKYKYKIFCIKCGQYFYRQRLNTKLIKFYRCRYLRWQVRYRRYKKRL